MSCLKTNIKCYSIALSFCKSTISLLIIIFCVIGIKIGRNTNCIAAKKQITINPS